MAKLVDVYPNGNEALVLDQALRLRYRDSFEHPVRSEKNQPYRIRVQLWSTALQFQPGHKIALHISSSNSPRFERHSNTWMPVAVMRKLSPRTIEYIGIRITHPHWSFLW